MAAKSIAVRDAKYLFHHEEGEDCDSCSCNDADAMFGSF
jgi:hypothetical protein